MLHLNRADAPSQLMERPEGLCGSRWVVNSCWAPSRLCQNTKGTFWFTQRLGAGAWALTGAGGSVESEGKAVSWSKSSRTQFSPRWDGARGMPGEPVGLRQALPSAWGAVKPRGLGLPRSSSGCRQAPLGNPAEPPWQRGGVRLGGLCQSGAGRAGSVTGPVGIWEKGALSGGKVPPLPACVSSLWISGDLVPRCLERGCALCKRWCRSTGSRLAEAPQLLGILLPGRFSPCQLCWIPCCLVTGCLGRAGRPAEALQGLSSARSSSS